MFNAYNRIIITQNTEEQALEDDEALQLAGEGTGQ